MYNITVYVGMDVHKESFTVCAYTVEADKVCRDLWLNLLLDKGHYI